MRFSKDFARLNFVLWLLVLPAAAQAACGTPRPAPTVTIAFDRTRLPAGNALTVRWSSVATDVSSCRAPLFLVFTTKARTRFTGTGFLAMPPGGVGPYGIAERVDETRVFIPLHALPASAAGSFGMKIYSAGEIGIDWMVVGTSDAEAARKPLVLAGAKAAQSITVEGGKPIIVVRDSLTPTIATGDAGVERPRRTIVSSSGEFELQEFDKFYRVREIRSGELVLERAGTSPNFSPTSRFIGAFAEGEGFEVHDLYADTVVVSSARLNRQGGYEGTAHVAAWSRSDAVLALSFWGWGGVYVSQTLMDGQDIGQNASCHACQGIGVDLSLSLDTGLVTWFGQEKGWASLFEDIGSIKAAEASSKAFPGNNDYDEQTALQEKLSTESFATIKSRYLISGNLPNAKSVNADARDGSAWRIGSEPLRLSHACVLDNKGACSLGMQSDEGKAQLARLMTRRIDHKGRKDLVRKNPATAMATMQVADARLNRARATVSAGTSSSNVWKRLAQIGIPLDPNSHRDVAIQSFGWEQVSNKPDLVTAPLLGRLPAVQQALVAPGTDSFGVPGDPDERTELTKIDPKSVRQFAGWRIADTNYWLVYADYQTGNSSTPQNRYLQIISGRSSDGPTGRLNIVDLSTRLGVDGTLARHSGHAMATELDHPWPTGIDIVRLVDERYLLASGQWLHDNERWAIVHDLQSSKTLFFDGHVPDGAATTSIGLTSDTGAFVTATRNGPLHFWRTASGEHILTGNYVDDELVVWDRNGYFSATAEGSQFVFLKFPSLPGYLSFKQFAKTLQRPEVIKDALAGKPAPAAAALTPPPRLDLRATSVAGTPGRVRLRLTATAERPLAAVRVFVDGQPWIERAVTGLSLNSDETVEVPAQSRWLTAIAIDAAGAESTPVAQALPRDERPSHRRLFLLGVGTDAYPRLPANLQLHYAVSDARNFLTAVRGQRSGYYTSVQPTEFYDAPRLKTELPARVRALAQAAGPDDTIMLFASGHGYRAPNGRLYLLVGESEQARLEDTSLSWDELALAFAGTRARIIVFIDACHSGAVPDGGSNDEIADTLAARQVRFTVVAAAKGRQESFERAEFGGGVFTSAIVQALTGTSRSQLDSNGNGVIELTELYGRIKPAVLSLMAGQQTPWLARTDMVGEIPLF